MSQVHRLFYAVRPPADAQAEISSLRSQLCDENGLTGDSVAVERLHVTLHWLGDHIGEAPPDLVQRALVAGAGVGLEPFGVAFDHVGCMTQDRDLLVLSSSRGTSSLRRFQRELAQTMTDAGIGRYVRSSFNPHISLIYAKRGIDRQAVAPIRWKVDEFVLIDSLVNKSKHVVLGRWPLHARQLDLGW